MKQLLCMLSYPCSMFSEPIFNIYYYYIIIIYIFIDIIIRNQIYFTDLLLHHNMCSTYMRVYSNDILNYAQWLHELRTYNIDLIVLVGTYTYASIKREKGINKYKYYQYSFFVAKTLCAPLSVCIVCIHYAHAIGLPTYYVPQSYIFTYYVYIYTHIQVQVRI